MSLLLSAPSQHSLAPPPLRWTQVRAHLPIQQPSSSRPVPYRPRRLWRLKFCNSCGGARRKWTLPRGRLSEKRKGGRQPAVTTQQQAATTERGGTLRSKAARPYCPLRSVVPPPQDSFPDVASVRSVITAAAHGVQWHRVGVSTKLGGCLPALCRAPAPRCPHLQPP